MRLLTIILAAAAYAAATSCAARSPGRAPTAYDGWDAFSPASSSNGPWRSGWASTVGGELHPFEGTGNNAGLVFWHDPGRGMLVPMFGLNAAGEPRFGIPAGGVALHPGLGGEYAVLEWAAPRAGTWHVHVTFFAGDHGETEAFVVAGTARPFAAAATGTSPSYDGTLVLGAGDRVSFMVGLARDGALGDSTPVTVRIDLVDPASARDANPAGSASRGGQG